MRPLHIAIVAACSLLSAGLQAQPVYKIVGPDGKVTFSDRAPQDARATPLNVGAGAASAAAGTAALPPSLRKAAGQFPVTLYTSADCTPCNSARNLLINRGVPFTERTVSTNADIDALKRLSGDTSLPFGTIGQQQLKGFSDAEWTSYLNAAGYPQQSQLPSSYQRPAATPLVAEQPATATDKAAEPERAQRPQAPQMPDSGPTPSNPAGIIF